MTNVVSGFGGGNANGAGVGTEFLSMLAPPKDALKDYDNTKKHDEQTAAIPQIFRDAMSVREEVYGAMGVPLEAEFDEDDARSFHWVVYASVGQTSAASPQPANAAVPESKVDSDRRASATAQRLPVGTLRLIPPPHAPNKYKAEHPDADAPASKKFPDEAYIKFGRLAILAPYRSLGLAKLLVNTALAYATDNPDEVRPPPPPAKLEAATEEQQKAIIWEGLAMVHAQTAVKSLWEKHGFAEVLVDDKGEVEIDKEEGWIEEGIEHVAMWRRLKLDSNRL